MELGSLTWRNWPLFCGQIWQNFPTAIIYSGNGPESTGSAC